MQSGAAPKGAPCGPPGMSQGCGGLAPPSSNAYMVNSKIMVVAVGVLFAVVVFILCLHLYAKWFWRHQRRLAAAEGGQGRTRSWRMRGRTRHDSRVQNPVSRLVQSVGLEKAVIEALPAFEFDGEAAKGGPLECAVCLEDFEHGERGRTLPRCGHHFHLDCVDMWLHSHSTCPLCRAGVQSDESKPKDANAVTVTIDAQPHVPVISEVRAPFVAAMRASRRQRQQSRNSSQLPASPTSLLSDLIEDPVVAEPQTPAREPEEAPSSHETAAIDSKALPRENETSTPGEIPSNVLFWGDQSHVSTTQGAPQPSASTIRAPFQVTIDIPQLGQSRDASSLHPANVMSPMARASASFRRLLTRGKSVVSPRDDDAADEGGPSSNSPRTPPSAPPPPPPPPPSDASS